MTSIRALEQHGDGDLTKGLPNIEKHMENVKNWGLPAVIVLNRFPDDTTEKIEVLRKFCKGHDWPMEVSEVFAKGSEGGISLASAVIEAADTGSNMTRTYELSDSIKTKTEKLATKVYGARGVTYSEDAETQIRSLEKRGYGKLPVCVAKTQFSLSDNPKLRGRPAGFDVLVREVQVNAGAGFVVVLMGEVMLMPGLPKQPAAEGMGLDERGEIFGVF